jgi:hypothetical protein
VHTRLRRNEWLAMELLQQINLGDRQDPLLPTMPKTHAQRALNAKTRWNS